MYIAYDRREAAVTLFPVFVLEVDAQHGFAALAYGDIAYKYIFYDSTAAGTGLDTDDTVQIGAVHLAVFYIQVAVTAGDFTAYYHTAMAVLHEAIAYDDVFTGYIPLASIGITPGFDGNAVITGIEGAVLDQYVLAGFRITAVSVGAAVEYFYASNGETLAKQRVDYPEW